MDLGSKFLYEEPDILSKWGGLPKTTPDSVAKNLNPRYELRPYQIEACAN
jgi:type III restriction enzyme